MTTCVIVEEATGRRWVEYRVREGDDVTDEAAANCLRTGLGDTYVVTVERRGIVVRQSSWRGVIVRVRPRPDGSRAVQVIDAIPSTGKRLLLAPLLLVFPVIPSVMNALLDKCLPIRHTVAALLHKHLLDGE